MIDSPKQIVVRNFVTHEAPDIDDVTAWHMFSQTVTPEYDGTQNAGIVLRLDRSFNDNTANELEAQGDVPIGTLGHWSDEHPKDGQSRIDGDCCALRVANRLGLKNKPEFHRIIRYAQEQNNSTKGGEFDLGPLIKHAFRYCCEDETGNLSTVKIADVFFAAKIFLSAVQANSRAIDLKQYPTGTVPYSMCDIIAAWLVTNKFSFSSPRRELLRCKPEEVRGWLDACSKYTLTKRPELARIVEYAQANVRVDNSWTESKFDLASLVRLAFIHRVADEKDIIEATYLFLTAMMQKERSFHFEVREAWGNPRLTEHRFVQTRVGKMLHEFRITAGCTDRPEFQKFCRSKEGDYAAVVIQKQMSGNVQIFFEQSCGFDAAAVMARIRVAERSVQGLTDNLPEDFLRSEGDSVPGADNWYFDGHQCLNGSLTAAKAPTVLHFDDIIQIVYEEIDAQATAVARKLFNEKIQRLASRREQVVEELAQIDRQMR